MNSEKDYLENTQIQMRKGILEFCILHIISRGEIYSSHIIEELREAKILVAEGTLYPLLSRLRKAGLLDYSWKESSVGPPQKHYQLTGIGQEFLEKLNETWIELVESTNRIISKHHVHQFHKLPNIELDVLKVRRKS
ncbi:MAG: PadR family transcriptional regulator [Microscillaceae bacterium]|nr:PadR family transcriptional regulator [Microscillaceae bacterium]